MRAVLTLALLAVVCSACDDAMRPIQDASLLLPWSEISARIVYATPNELNVIDARRREVRTVRGVIDNELYVDLASAPLQIAAGVLRTDGSTRIRVMDFNGSESRVIDRATCGRWLPDGRLSYLRGDTLMVETTRLLVLTPSPRSCPAWSADGSFFIIALADTTRLSRMYRVNVANPAPQALELIAIGGPRTSFNDPAVAPGSQVFALIYASDDPLTEILFANTAGGIIRKVAEGTRLYGLSWSPDGTQMLAVSTVSTAGGLFLIRVSDGAVRKLVEHPVYAASWGP